MFLCKILDLPKVPTELVAPGALQESYVGWVHTLEDGSREFSANHPLYHVSEELKSWVNENIYSGYKKIGIKHAEGDPEHPFIGLHTDATRKYVLQYNLDSAGGKLHYWKEHGQPLLRDRRIYLGDYNDVDLVEVVDVPDHTWHLINAMVLHSVEGINGTRVNLQLSLDHAPF